MTAPATDFATAPRCSFYERIQVTADPTYRYEKIEIASSRNDGVLRTPYPPAVGDLITLYDRLRKAGGTYRVIERAWSHASFGSTNWPLGLKDAHVGPMLDVVVEPTVGPFVNEAPFESEADHGEQ